jgi:oxygen-independent coproporphyrinogen-3 oxidase
MKDLGIYIHIPFCAVKCRYCDFYSIVADDSVKSLYLDALIKHLNKAAARMNGYRVDTIYIGGGTPSVMTGAMFKKLFDGLRRFHISGGCEITVEVNPGTVDAGKAAAMRSLGVNRISIGAQSLCDSELKYLGRIHDRADIKKSYEMFRKHGFDNISMDLMFAVPGQTMKSFKKTLERAAGMGPEHISAYPLKIEDGTVFGAMKREGSLKEFDEDLDRDMYHMMTGFLEGHGYRQYEISSFAKPGKMSRHNMRYWDLSEYAGFGASAHSFIDHERYRNSNDVYGYITDPEAREEVVKYSSEDLMKEYMMLGLRKTDGVAGTEFKDRFGEDMYGMFGGTIDKLVQAGLLLKEGDHVRLTAGGLDLANQAFVEFI